jgi:hypothetical protein
MTTPAPERCCMMCGAARQIEKHGVIKYQCRSKHDWQFIQSKNCKIACAEQRVNRLTAERDAALKLLREWRLLQDKPGIEAWDLRVTELLKETT